MSTPTKKIKNFSVGGLFLFLCATACAVLALPNGSRGDTTYQPRSGKDAWPLPAIENGQAKRPMMILQARHPHLLHQLAESLGACPESSTWWEQNTRCSQNTRCEQNTWFGQSIRCGQITSPKGDHNAEACLRHMAVSRHRCSISPPLEPIRPQIGCYGNLGRHRMSISKLSRSKRTHQGKMPPTNPSGNTARHACNIHTDD